MLPHLNCESIRNRVGSVNDRDGGIKYDIRRVRRKPHNGIVERDEQPRTAPREAMAVQRREIKRTERPHDVAWFTRAAVVPNLNCQFTRRLCFG